MRVVFRGVAAALAVVLLSAGPASPWDPTEFKDEDGSNRTSHPDWMAWLPDDVSVADVTLPGTHDTATEAASVFSRTQAYTVAEQLDAGIRLLDVRCRHIQDVFTLHHGAEYLGLTFGGGAVEPCRDFLAAHPTETIFMRIKEEHDEEDTTRSFRKTFEEYRNVHYPGVFWDPGDEGEEHGVPALGEVRGKIVVLQNFDGEGQHYGLDWGNFQIQDEYDVWDGFCDLHYCHEEKWDDVRATFDAADLRDSLTVTVNFLSGSTHIAPGTLADYVNDRALGYLLDGHVDAKAGWVMTDFPGAGLVSALIACNMHRATAAGDLQASFARLVLDVLDSTRGDAFERYEDVAPYLRHVLRGRPWHVFVARPGWAYSLAQDGLSVATDHDGFRFVAFTSGNVDSRYSAAEIAAFVDAQLGGLSGGIGDRRTLLADVVRARFPHQGFGILVKQEPGGFENWTYSLPGTVHRTDWVDGYTYVVWAYSLVNTPPVADAGPPQTHECTGAPIDVVLDGGGSTDAEGDALTYVWTGPFDGGVAAGVRPTVRFSGGVGVHPVTLRVHDPWASSAPATTTVTIQDTTPPVVTLSLRRTTLWPATRGLVDVGATASAIDVCDAALPVSIAVHGDEEAGVPPWAPDAAVVAGTLRLRAERRSEPGADGRVYLVVASATDASGNVGYAVETVVVPVTLAVGHVTALTTGAAAREAAFLATSAAPAGWPTLLGTTPWP
jgi:1-phosphatidylinositol phosphodiesterase